MAAHLGGPLPAALRRDAFPKVVTHFLWDGIRLIVMEIVFVFVVGDLDQDRTAIHQSIIRIVSSVNANEIRSI